MKNVLLLGQRQIAWRAMTTLSRKDNQDALHVAVLVTDADTYKRSIEEFPGWSPKFISNEKRHEDAIFASIEENRIDMIISIQHNWILSKRIIQAVSGNAFNLHNARLPHYQGYNSISHAILNGDAMYHSTLHWMEELVDSGDIVLEELTPLDPEDTALSLHRKTIEAANVMFEAFIDILRSGRPIPRTKLEDVEPKFYGKNSLKEIADATGISDPVRLDRLSRALFYPPHNMAYVRSGESLSYLLPRGGIAALRELGMKTS